MPAASWLIVVWLSVVGAAIGSFLNVVVWRLPRGGNLIGPPSHCPKCRRPIRWYDNIPIVSWFLLRGRCRDCHTSISARYPLIETACLASFLILAILECGLLGVNLPVRHSVVAEEIVLVSGWSGRELYGLFLFHQLLWCTLLAAGLIEYDGHRVGWRVVAPAIGLAAVAGSVMPRLYPVPVWSGVEGWYAGIATSAAGLAAGAAIGWLLSRWEPAARRNGVWFGLTCIGGILGWQSAAGLAAITVLWQLFATVMGPRIAPIRRVPTSLVLVLLTFAWLVAWAPLVHWIPWLG
jgi:leader peptidase (prepilin peptidase) / N-methyltransferase